MYSLNRDQLILLLTAVQFVEITIKPEENLKEIEIVLKNILSDLSESDYNSLIICKH